MKIAIAGVGLRSSHVLSIFQSLEPDLEFVGYFDPQPTHLYEIDAAMPGFDSAASMLNQTKPDLFFIGSPNIFHLEHIRAGLESNVPHIFTEKPVVISIEETLALSELLAKHSGVSRVMVGLVLRYSQHMMDLRSALDAGVLGPITSLEANEHIAPYHGSFFMRDWRRKSSLSGGFILEKCCHDLDLYNWITGSRPTRVASFGGKRSFVAEHAHLTEKEQEIFSSKPSVWQAAEDAFTADGDIIDFQTALLEYETGASLAFHTNSNVPDEHRRFCVMGAKGMAEGDFVRGYLKVTQRDGSVYMDRDYRADGLKQSKAHYGADHRMVANILQHLKNASTPLPVSIVDALEAGIAALALDQARINRQVVELGRTWDAFDSYGLRIER